MKKSTEVRLKIEENAVKTGLPWKGLFKRRKERETTYIVIVIICLFYKSITINSYKIIRRQMGNSTFVPLEVWKSQKDNLMRVNMPPWRPLKSDAIVVTCPMNQYRQPLSRTAHAGRRMGRHLYFLMYFLHVFSTMHWAARWPILFTYHLDDPQISFCDLSWSF